MKKRRRPPISGRRAPAASLILLASLLVGCESPGSTARADACRVAQPPQALDARIPETSGAAVSRQHTGITWTHNDSGAEAELFAVDAAGELEGSATLRGADPIDWEDIAVAECPSGSCLYVADVGDNNSRRATVDVYRLPEPAPTASMPVEAERFRVRYPGGPRDAESIFVLPPERLFVVTRGRAHPIAVYAYPGPLRSDSVVELQRVRTLSTAAVPHDDQVTGADATADGRWVVLRTPSALFFYRTEQLLERGEDRPIRATLTGLGEVQGEGVAIGDNGAVVLTSEGFGGMQGTIAMLWCEFLK